ncbi:MAG: beta-propeller domain-containing protein, partial [Nitrosopumilaceae archaeon]
MKNSSIYIIIASIIVAAVALAVVLVYSPTQSSVTQNGIQNNVSIQAPIQNVKKFNSTDELQKFLLDSQVQTSGQYYGGPVHGGMVERLVPAQEGVAIPLPPVATGAPTGQVQQGAATTNAGDQYSTTNVQVAGIDEPDFLKNDNKYAYVLSQDKLTIIDAYPGETAKIVSKVGLDVKGNSLQNMFLNKDRLVIFYNDNTEQYAIPQYDYMPNPIYTPVTHAVIIDVSDKENPKIVKNYEMTGYYTGARMIGDYVYLISNSYVDYVHP